MKMPIQFYMYAIVLCCYQWPWYFFSGDDGALFTVITIQLLLVISCNILVSEPWKYAVILIEAFCMLFNVTLFLMPMSISEFHAQIMLVAFIIELLIITISIQGAIVGRSDHYRVPVASHNLWAARGGVFGIYRSERALS